jgi:23S rRNA pseudouridine2605 synthase
VREIGRKIGLARTLSKLGYCSRSRAAELTRAGRVTLNGKIRRDPEPRYPGRIILQSMENWLIHKQRSI